MLIKVDGTRSITILRQRPTRSASFGRRCWARDRGCVPRCGISGSKGRDQRTGFDDMHKDEARRRFDVVMAWSVDRLGRSLQDRCGFLSELHSLGIDLFLHQQGITPRRLRVRPCSR
jgi:DNA invertase Pin-like site-specific DNA recombinase